MTFQFYQKLKSSLINNHPSPETEQLIENMQDIQTTLLFIVKYNEIALLKMIINNRPDISLDVANHRKKTLLLQSILDEKYKFATILINSGVNVNLADNGKKTPLHVAVKKNNLELASTLLNHQANVNAQQLNGETPLMTLYNSQKHSVTRVKDIFHLLLINGADVNICNDLGQTAIVKFLKEYDSVSPDNILQIVEHACMLLYYGANPNYIDKYNNSSLINSLRLANHQFIELLFSSYDGLNGDDCHKVFYTILENPLSHNIDIPIIVAILEKFEKFVTNTKVHFEKYTFIYLTKHCWPKYTKHFYVAAAHIINLNKKMKNYNLTDYLEFDSNYYCNLVSPSEIRNFRVNIMKLIWNSLAMGINCTILDLVCVWHQFGLQKEIFALIWGSIHQTLLENREWLAISTPGRFTLTRRWYFYFNIFNADIESGSRSMRNYLSDHPEYQLYTSYMTMLSSKTRLKTLAELSRDAGRAFIKQQFRTRHFYDVHEIINNLDLPQRVKWILQRRIKVNCYMCGATWCRCD